MSWIMDLEDVLFLVPTTCRAGKRKNKKQTKTKKQNQPGELESIAVLNQ